MKRIARILFVLTLPWWLSACSFLGGIFGDSDDGGPSPAPLTDFKAEAELKKVWSVNIGAGTDDQFLRLRPVIQGERILAADSKGLIVALNRSNGKKLWQRKLNLSVSGGIGQGFGLLLLGTRDGQVIALDAESGEERWRAKLSSEILAVPQTNGKIVVVHSLDEKVYGLDHQTGEQRWFYEGVVPALSLRGTSTPAVNADLAIVGLASGKVVALNIENGQPFWEKRISVPQGSSELERMTDVDGDILVQGGMIVANGYQGTTSVFELTSARTRWQRDISSATSPAEGFGNVYVSDQNGTITAFDQANGQSVWVQPALEYRKLTSPVTFGNYVVVGDYEGYVHLMSQVDGRFVARRKVDGDAILAKPVTQGDLLYVYGSSGDLVALRVQ